MDRKEAEERSKVTHVLITNEEAWIRNSLEVQHAKGFLEGSDSERKRAEKLVAATNEVVRCRRESINLGKSIGTCDRDICEKHWADLKEALSEYRKGK